MKNAIIIGILLCLLGIFSAGSVIAQTNVGSPLGVNVREIRYWGTEMHLLDFFKRAGNGSSGIWLTQCAYPCNNGSTWNTGEQALLDLDASGWPRSLPAAGSAAIYRWVSTILWMNSDKLPLGRWTVLYEGEGTLSYGQTNVVRNAAASAPGRDAFDVSAGANTLILSITATDPNRTGNYLRNIRVIPPGGTCDNDPYNYAANAAVCPSTYRPFTETYATQVFHPQFLSDLRPFAALRFMQFFSTNLDQTTTWNQRSQVSDISWGYNGNRGAPIEVALDLANSLDASPWLSIPAMVDDDYIVQYARLAKSRLTTARPVYVEYGNEVWNGSYPYSIAAQWIKEQGRARWPASREADYTKQMNWFAMRTKQICTLWKQVFAERASQVKCVMGAQGSDAWTADHTILACPLHAAEPNGSACDSAGGIDALAGGYYVGGHVNNPVFQAEIEAQWYTQADGGLSRLFQEITTGDALTSPAGSSMVHASVAAIASQVAAIKPVADRHGVELVAYEAGNELRGRDSSAYHLKLQALVEAAERDPRMGQVYRSLLEQWQTAGGHLFMVFESTGAYSATRGNSTLLEWTGQSRSESPKYDAVLSFIADHRCNWAGCTPVATAEFIGGWNLAGYGMDASIDVAATFGDASKVNSVWKWIARGSTPGLVYPTWAFYAPALANGGRAFAAERRYEVLSTIAGGEGYWVSAAKAFSIELPKAEPVRSSSFLPATGGAGGGRRALAGGWSLIASGDRPTPAHFDSALARTGLGGSVTSLWAWDAGKQRWVFWAPSLANSGDLASFLVARGYGDFSDLPAASAGTLEPFRGFWVKLP